MIEFIIRRFIKNYEDTDDKHVREQYSILGGILGIICNLFLFVSKFLVGMMSNSIGILSDAFNNLTDMGSSFISIISAKLSNRPPDKEHPFGHGRLEYVAGLVIAVIIIAVGIDFFKSAAERIFHPVETVVSNWGMLAVALAIPVKFWMFLFNRKLGKKIDSTVLQATAFDSLSDILTTSVVLASAAVSRFTSFPADGYAGVAVAVLIILGGIKVVRDTVNPLLGECPDRQLVEELERKMLENPDIYGVHDLILHNYGPGRYFATAHAEVNSDCDPVKIHDSLERTEREVALALPVQLTLHCDPFDRDDPEYKSWRLATVNAAESIDPRFRVYDFRMAKTAHCRHLRFNLLVPRNYALSNRELRERIQTILRERDPGVKVSPVVENTFV